ncbi:MAG: recombinase family protein [Pyramidobacter sp.]|nr:recombinase family protein [Pyramidobacter sp.]
MKKYGYIRVSSLDQNEARQRESMRAQKVPQSRVFIDKQSGKDFERVQYRRLVRRLERGDVLVLHSIDRLGRNYREIQEQWRYLTREKGVDILVLDMPLLDIRASKDLMGTFIADLVLQLLSFIAENERANIRKRQAEGIAAARARGVHLGRPKPELTDNFLHLLHHWNMGEITALDAAYRCNVPLSTFLYRARKYTAER